MWEVFTCGRTPYLGIPVMYIIIIVKGIKVGRRLEKIDNDACLHG